MESEIGVLLGPVKIKGFEEQLLGVVVGAYLQVALAEDGEDVGVVKARLSLLLLLEILAPPLDNLVLNIFFRLAHHQLPVLFERDGQVVDGLLVALVVQIGFSDLAVSLHQDELRLVVGEH